ncbi:hypothetical protein [Noviluteimonas dokdonensis]|nr:hypothetical protein [Lysobacter dokdonensis]
MDKLDQLYQRAEETSAHLFRTFQSDEDFLDDAVVALDAEGLTTLSSQAQREAAVALCFARVREAAAGVDPRHAIPGLALATERYYYGDEELTQSLPMLGTAMKSAIALAWNNVRSPSPPVCVCDDAGLCKLVKAIAAWELLNLHADQAHVFGFGTSVVHAGGLEMLSDRDLGLIHAWQRYTQGRGTNQRTLAQSQQVVWGRFQEFQRAVIEVLRGASPRSMPVFRGTLFEAIGSLDFWLGLYVRFMLLQGVLRMRIAREGAQAAASLGITLFREFPLAFEGIENIPRDKVEAVVHNVFWRRPWYESRIDGPLANMWPERPAIRIDEDTFCVGIANVMDSVNNFIESAVMASQGFGDVKVDPVVFQTYVSRRFEDEVCALFRKAGFTAGSLTTRHAWHTGDDPEPIDHAHRARIPGEIDVVAWHPERRLLLVCECKVLVSPASRRVLTNVWSKLGPDDSKGFHRNLDAKLEWIRGVSRFGDATVIGLLVVDQGAFLAGDAQHRVVELAELEAMLGNLDQLSTRAAGSAPTRTG